MCWETEGNFCLLIFQRVRCFVIARGHDIPPGLQWSVMMGPTCCWCSIGSDFRDRPGILFIVDNLSSASTLGSNTLSSRAIAKSYVCRHIERCFDYTRRNLRSSGTDQLYPSSPKSSSTRTHSASSDSLQVKNNSKRDPRSALVPNIQNITEKYHPIIFSQMLGRVVQMLAFYSMVNI